MICNYCGMQLPDGTTFCPNCGAPTAAQPQVSSQEPQQSYYQGQQQIYYQAQQNFDQSQQPYDPSQQGYYQAQQQAYYQAQQPQAYGASPYQTAPAAAADTKKRRSPLPWILIGAAVLALLAVAVLVIIPKVQKSNQYNTALRYMEEGRFDEAIVCFEALGDYSDSRDRIDEAKYQFVKQNFDRENQKTVNYLQELMDRGYKDAAALYPELYAWRLSISCLNTDPDDESTVDGVISKYVDYLHLRGSLEGGAPGEQVKGKLVLALPDGSLTDLEELDGVLEAGKDFACELENGLFDVPGAVTGGPSQLQVRDTDSDKLLAACDFELSDRSIWKAKLLFWNTEKDDKETIADSISKYTTYYHGRFRFYGGVSNEKINVTMKRVYPDGSSHVWENFWTAAASGNEKGIYGDDYLIIQPDLMPAGTMTVELYNADTDELLGAFEFQLTDEAVAEPAFKGTISLKYSNDDPNDTETLNKSISRYASYFHYGYYDSDDSSSGEVSLRRLTVYPDGKSVSKDITFNFDKKAWDSNQLAQGLADDSHLTEAGPLVVKFYDMVSNQLVGEFTFKITDDKPEQSVYADKITATWINGNESDRTTTATSVGIGSYLHFGFKIEGAEPGKMLNIQQTYYFSFGTWGFYPDAFLSTYKVQEDGTITFEIPVESGFSTNSTMELYLYDHDSYELLAYYTIEITD